MSLDLPINKIGRASPTLLNQLKKVQINTIRQLTERVRNLDELEQLAGSIGVNADELFRLHQRCRLRQINGVGTIFEFLLELAGIISVEQLAVCDPAELYSRLAQVNKQERLSRRSPTPEEVFDWVEASRTLKPF